MTAVFFSLAAVATGMDAGTVQPNDIQDVELNSGDGLASISSGFGILESLLTNRPEPEKQVRLNFQSADDVRFKVRDADLRVADMKNYTGDSSIMSDENILFTGVRGSADFTNGSSISGKAKGFRSSGVNVTSGFPLDISGLESRTTFQNVDRIKLNMNNVRGEISSSSVSTRLNGTNVRINSFSGDITVFPGNSSYVVEGKVDELKAADFTISSDS